jgi:PHD/YefM family antitoxin component YafN of YafNO toxin-antitoxin module
MPISAAARKGVSRLTVEAAERRILLTSHGRPVAVVDTAERLDDDLRRLREAARLVVGQAADQSLDQAPAGLSLEQVCARLELDVAEVRRRGAELADRYDAG